MTQPSATDTVTTPSTTETPAATPAPLLLPPELRDRMSPDILAELDAQPGQSPAPTGDEQPTDAPQQQTPPAKTAGGNEANADGADAEPTPDEAAVLQTYVDLIDENPANISQIPRAKQPAAVAQWKASIEDAATKAVENAYNMGQQAAIQNLRIQTAVEEIDGLIKEGLVDDAEEAMSKFPGGKQNYYRAKAAMPTEVAPGSPGEFQTQLNSLFEDLKPYPEAQAEFSRMFQANPYKATQADLLRAARDIGSLVERAKTNTPDPARVTLTARRNGIANARTAPKPDVTPGTSVGNDVLTHEKLKTMTTTQIREYEKRFPGSIDKVLQSSGA